MAIQGFAAARAAVVFVALMTLAGCGKNHFTWTQKVTVEVETPSGIASGSSVVHVIATGGGKRMGMDGPNSSSKIVGEAAVVDLGGGRYLFALLSGKGNSYKGRANNIAEFAFCSKEQREPGEDCFAHLRDLAPGTVAQLQPDNYPLLVTFDDINDPKTVKLVDPANLPATLGPGFALKSITIEITDEKVTGGKVESVLPWFETLPQTGLCPPTFEPINESPLCSLLGKREFIQRTL